MQPPPSRAPLPRPPPLRRRLSVLLLFLRSRALALLCALALLSSVVYLIDVRRRYPAVAWDVEALGAELAVWSGGAAPGGPLYYGVRSRAVPVRPLRGGDGGGRYGLRRVHCRWPPLAVPPRNSTANSAHGAGVGRLVLFFIHGNAGGASQGHHLCCAAVLQAALLAGAAPHTAHTYTFHFAEEANVHRGLLMQRQADFVADAVEGVVGSHTAPGRPAAVWLIGHSMGGIVARAAAALSAVDVAVLTLNAPHRYPPLLLDRPQRQLYAALNAVATRPVPRHSASGVARGTGPRTSAELVRACAGGGSGDGVAACRPFRSPMALLSLTSGAMDLQIESATTFPLCAAAHRCVHADLSGGGACRHSASHDGVLTDPCMAAYAVAAALNATAAAWGPSAPPPPRAAAVPTATAAAPGPPLPGLHWAGALGRLLWVAHAWPFAVAVFLSALLLPPTAAWAAALHSCRQRRRHELPLGAPDIDPQSSGGVRAAVGRAAADPTAAAACIVLLVSALLLLRHVVLDADADADAPTAATAAVPAAMVGGGRVLAVAPRCAVPWSCDRWSRPIGGARVLLLAAVAGSVGAAAAAAVQRLVGVACAVVAWAVHRPPLVGRQRPRRRGAVAVAIAAVYAATLLTLPSLTWRALVWVALSPLAAATAPFGLAAPLRGGSGGRLAPTEGRAVVLFALLHLVQLHPFFTLRNEFVSRTADSAATVDPLVFATEAAVAALLAVTAASPDWRATRTPSVRPRAVELAAAAGAVVGCVGIAATPLDVGRLAPALLLAFPSFVLWGSPPPAPEP